MNTRKWVTLGHENVTVHKSGTNNRSDSAREETGNIARDWETSKGQEEKDTIATSVQFGVKENS
jgi:hypothetical protein